MSVALLFWNPEMPFAQVISVRRSRVHSLLMLGMAAFCLVTAGLMPTGKIGAFAFGSSYWIPLVLVVLALCLIFKWYRMPAGYRLSVTADSHFHIMPDTQHPVDADTQEQWEMLADSTIWTSVIILRLQTESGRKKTLVIFPDAVEADAFRNLYTACNWRLMHLRTPSSRS